MRIKLTSLVVDDQEKALRFYTDVLRFIKKNEIPMGPYRWLTVVSAEDPTGAELSLEPNVHPAAKAFQQAMFAFTIPLASFEVSDLEADCARLRSLGVAFVREPLNAGPVRVALLDDTCGNVVQLYQVLDAA